MSDWLMRRKWLGWEDISYTTMKTTTTRVNYLDLNFHLDYLVYGKDSKLKLFLSPAIKTEYALGASYKTTKTDESTTNDHYSDLKDYYPSSIASWAVSGILKYEPTRYMGTYILLLSIQASSVNFKALMIINTKG
ncbi:MAG: hypothetical protein AB2L20_11045 [Mangrovibacterium sp.]